MSDDKKELTPPAFQFYADDFLSGTLDMTVDEVGVYIRLLSYSWSKGSVSDVGRLSWIGARAETIEYVLAVKFRKTDRGWINDRLEAIRAKQAARRNAGSLGGQASQANRRKDKKTPSKQTTSKARSKREAKNRANGQAKSNPPSPSPSPSPPPANQGSDSGSGHQTPEPTASGLVAGNLDLVSVFCSELRSVGLNRFRAAATELADLGVTREQLGLAIATYEANRDKFDGPGAIVSFLREGCWPVDGVVDSDKAQRESQRKREKQDYQRKQNLMADVIQAGRKAKLSDDEIKKRLAEKLPVEFLVKEGWA